MLLAPRPTFTVFMPTAQQRLWCIESTRPTPQDGCDCTPQPSPALESNLDLVCHFKKRRIQCPVAFGSNRRVALLLYFTRRPQPFCGRRLSFDILGSNFGGTIDGTVHLVMKHTQKRFSTISRVPLPYGSFLGKKRRSAHGEPTNITWRISHNCRPHIPRLRTTNLCKLVPSLASTNEAHHASWSPDARKGGKT